MSDEASSGLPMTAKWDPEHLQREIADLHELKNKPFFPRVSGYVKRTGPGLLQSAMTLGAGSATASVIAGASFGYKLLWVQPLAMFLGVMMLAALANIVLTRGERPYKSFGRETSKTLVLFWALGTIMASIIWHFPQYGLAASAARDMASMAGMITLDANGDFTSAGLIVSFGIGLLILGINIFTVWSYGGSARGIRMYEWFLRTVIGLIVVMFAIVVIASIGKINWIEMGKGFIGWYGIPEYTNPKHITLVLGMLGAAVGINMTFLYPYTLLAKGWGNDHKTLARWDLGMSMFLPFALVTSLVIVAMTITGVYDGQDTLREGMKPIAAAASLHGLLGKNVGRIVFDLGLIGMTCTAISTHMVVCGFTFCEMFGLNYTKTLFRIFALVPAIGLFGVVAKLPFWFPVAASAVCFAMLPIAYLLFYLLNNKEKYLGDGMMKWPKRELFNILLVIALVMSVIGSIIQINNKVVKKLFGQSAKASAATPAVPAATPDPSPEKPEAK